MGDELCDSSALRSLLLQLLPHSLPTVRESVSRVGRSSSQIPFLHGCNHGTETCWTEMLDSSVDNPKKKKRGGLAERRMRWSNEILNPRKDTVCALLNCKPSLQLPPRVLSLTIISTSTHPNHPQEEGSYKEAKEEIQQKEWQHVSHRAPSWMTSTLVSFAKMRRRRRRSEDG